MHPNSAHRFNPKAIAWCLLGSFILCALHAAAQAPLSLGSDTISVGTSIQVLRPGPDLQSILDGITDASAAKPYLLHLGPGVYELTERLVMKPYVDVAGSGENVTILRGPFDSSDLSSSGVVLMALHSTLSHLAVENSASSGALIVAVTAYNLDLVGDASTARLLHVTVESAGSPSSSARGVHMEESSIRIEHVTAKVTGTSTNYGIRAYDSSPVVRNASATVHSGTTNRAFYISEAGAQPVLTETTAVATGMESYGYYVSSSADPTILRSTIRGETGAINAASSNSFVIVAQSLLEGTVTGSGTLQCVANIDENGLEREAACEQAMLDAPE